MRLSQGDRIFLPNKPDKPTNQSFIFTSSLHQTSPSSPPLSAHFLPQHSSSCLVFSLLLTDPGLHKLFMSWCDKLAVFFLCQAMETFMTFSADINETWAEHVFSCVLFFSNHVCCNSQSHIFSPLDIISASLQLLKASDLNNFIRCLQTLTTWVLHYNEYLMRLKMEVRAHRKARCESGEMA